MTAHNKHDEKLDAYIKSNIKDAPDPPLNEFQNILNRIEEKRNKRIHLWHNILVPTFVAATILLMVWAPDLRDTFVPPVAQQDNPLEDFLEDTFGMVYNGNVYTNADLTVGEDWLILLEDS